MCTGDGKSRFPERVCAAEGPDPCELAQNPRYRKGPDVCFDNNEDVSLGPHMCSCADVIVGNSSISEASQLASIYSVWSSSALGFQHKFVASPTFCSSSYDPSCIYPSDLIYPLLVLWILHVFFSPLLHVSLCLYILFSLFSVSLLFYAFPFRWLLLLSITIGWALVSNQQRFWVEAHTSSVDAGAELRVSVTISLHQSLIWPGPPTALFPFLDITITRTANFRDGLMWIFEITQIVLL